MGALIFYSPNTGEIVGEINEIQEISIESVSINETTSPFSLEKEAEFVMDGVIMDRNQILSILYGKRITNNYLKLHGGVMKRRRKYVRTKRNHR